MKYRDQFGKMPPLKHDKITASSEVVMHIASGISCDIERANKLFNELRKRRIIVFDKLDRTWHGIDNRSIRHTDSDRIRMLEIRLETLENKHKKLLAAYRALDTASQHQRIDCDTCGGDGWRKAHAPECTDPSHEDCGHNCPLTACHCDAGSPNRDVLRRINEHRPKPRPAVVADPMAAARGRAIAERAQGAERARLATFRVGTHINDIEEAS